MQALTLDAFGLDRLKYADRPDPTPEPGEILVRINAVSLNFRDLMVCTGRYNPRMRLPAVPGSDAAGEVAAVGPGVSTYKVGDRVTTCFFPDWVAGTPTDANVATALGGGIGPGVLAEAVVLPERGVVATPPHLSDEEAATLPCAALTAWNALFETGAVGPGQTVLTLGTGGVSLFALQFAKLAGARVIVTSSRDEKLARAKDLGAEEGINYTSEPEWERRARELTGGVGVDHVIELGGAGTLAKSLKAVRRAGTVSLIGVLSGAGSADPMAVLINAIRLQGIFVGSRQMFEAMNRAIALHQLRPVIDRVFPFAEARAALDHMASGQHFGKIVIRIGG